MRKCSSLWLTWFLIAIALGPHQARAQDQDDFSEWNVLRRQYEDIRMRFLAQYRDRNDRELVEVGDSTLRDLEGILGFEPKGENSKGFITNLRAQVEALGRAVNGIEMLSPGKRAPKILKRQIQMVGSDLNVKVDYMRSHADAPLGYVSVRAVACGPNGIVEKPTPLLYMTEGDFENEGPGKATKFGTTNTRYDTLLTPGRWVFFEEGSDPRHRAKMNRERIGSQGKTHTVEWLVKP